MAWRFIEEVGLATSRTSRASELQALSLCGPQANRPFCEGIHSMLEQVCGKNQMNIEEAAALGGAYAPSAQEEGCVSI